MLYFNQVKDELEKKGSRQIGRMIMIFTGETVTKMKMTINVIVHEVLKQINDRV